MVRGASDMRAGLLAGVFVMLSTSVLAQPWPNREAYEGYLKTQLLANFNALKAAMDDKCDDEGFKFSQYHHCPQIAWPVSLEIPIVVLGETVPPVGELWPHHNYGPPHRPYSTADASIGEIQLELTYLAQWTANEYGSELGGTAPGWWIQLCFCYRDLDWSNAGMRCFTRGSGPLDYNVSQWFDGDQAQCPQQPE